MESLARRGRVRYVVMLALVGVLLVGCAVGPSRQRPDELTSATSADADSCFAGDVAACDRLRDGTTQGSELNIYAATCGGRVPDVATSGCGAAFGDVLPPIAGPAPAEPESEFENAVNACSDGHATACDELAERAPPDSRLHEYGVTCGQRLEATGDCVGRFGARLPQSFPLSPITTDPVAAAAVDACAATVSECDALRSSPDALVALYGVRCGGRTTNASDCAAAFAGQAIPPALPSDLGALAGDPSARRCQEGDLGACDDLAGSTGDVAARYGASCGGRTAPDGSCTSAFSNVIGDGELGFLIIDELTEQVEELIAPCRGSDMAACDTLRARAESAGFHEAAQYAATCGGRSTDALDSCAEDPLMSMLAPASDWSGLSDDEEDRVRQLAESCYGDDWSACVTLSEEAGPGYEEYEAFATNCGGYEDPADRPEGCLKAFTDAIEEQAQAAEVTVPATPATSSIADDPDVPEEASTADSPTEAASSPGGIEELERPVLYGLVGTLIESNREDLVVKVKGDLKVDRPARWEIQLNTDDEIAVPDEVHFVGQFQVDVRVRYDDDPGNFQATEGDARKLVGVVGPNGMTVSTTELGELLMTPSSSGKRQVAVEFVITDERGTEARARVELPEQEVSGPGASTTIWEFVITRLAPIVVIVGGLLGLLLKVLQILDRRRKQPPPSADAAPG